MYYCVLYTFTESMVTSTQFLGCTHIHTACANTCIADMSWRSALRYKRYFCLGKQTQHHRIEFYLLCGLCQRVGIADPSQRLCFGIYNNVWEVVDKSTQSQSPAVSWFKTQARTTGKHSFHCARWYDRMVNQGNVWFYQFACALYIIVSVWCIWFCLYLNLR